MSLNGIDVSSAQTGIDVTSMPIDFVIIKATGGDGYVNDQCDVVYQQAKNAGKLRGVYHYYGDGYSGNDPIAEANWFVDNILGYVKDSILVLDWERGGNSHVGDVNVAKQFLDQVQARTGVKPLIYMSASLVSELDWSSVIAGDYGLWVAAYPYSNTPIPNFQMNPDNDPNVSWGVVGEAMWQFTSTGRVDGYNGNLDCNFFYGDANTWQAYQGQPTPEVPTPPTPPTPPVVEPIVPPTPEPTPIVPPKPVVPVSPVVIHTTGNIHVHKTTKTFWLVALIKKLLGIK